MYHLMKKDIAFARLQSQQIVNSAFKAPKELVGFIGAIQAQDYEMCKWAVGLRLPHATTETVQAAVDKGEILRTHLLRPTWHLVSADDVYWMLELTAPNIRPSVKARHKELELDESVLKKSLGILGRELEDRHLTREEIGTIFERAKIATAENRLGHIMLWAELEGLVCSGASKGGRQTYALLSERVPKKNILAKEEALAALARRYFFSHSPATLQDFKWWSGLPMKAARYAYEMVKRDFTEETIGPDTYLIAGSFTAGRGGKDAFLLPAYDEFIISYRDRSASLLSEHHKKAISDNGLFRPVIVIEGQVAGIWKRAVKKDKVVIETSFFRNLSQKEKSLVAKAASAFGRFLGREEEIAL